MPHVRILATSREPLKAAGEYTYRLPSLSVPSRQVIGQLDATTARAFGAIVLFTDRARATDHRFTLTDENAPIVAEICWRLDGIPLAIELAAARVNLLSVKAIAERLDDRFRILIGGERTALPRQQTMRAAIDWSYNLLSAPEQRMFVRCSVFAGGCTLATAAAVCAGDEVAEDDVLELLSSLTDKSLVVADTSAEPERFWLLESTAAYALEKLSAQGERERLATRHAECFRKQAEAADARYGTGSTIAWFAGVEAELDNYRGALEWALTRGHDIVLGGAIAGALQPPDVGLVVQGHYWVELAVAGVSKAEHPAIAARLQLALCGLFNGKRRYEAAERAMRLYDCVGNLRGAARAQRLRAWALYEMGLVDEAGDATVQTLAVLRACGDTWGVARCCNQLGAIESTRGNLRAARELFAQALAGNRAIGDEVGTSQVLGNLAESEFAAGAPERASRFINEALELATLGKNLKLVGMWHRNCAAYRIALGDVMAAREALRAARQIRDEVTIASALQNLALLTTLRGDTRCGSQLLGYADAQYDRLGLRRERTDQWSCDKLRDALRERLSEDEIAKLAAEGEAWSEDQAVEEALKV